MLFTLVNHGEPLDDATLLRVRCQAADGQPRAYDLWDGEELHVTNEADGCYRVSGSVKKLSCILVTGVTRPAGKLARLLQLQCEQDWTARLENDQRNRAASVVYPVPVAPTKPAPVNAQLAGMVLVPKTQFTMDISHRTLECGCYPDPAADPKQWESQFFKMGRVQHHIGPATIGPFWIDETEVTNRQYKEFLDATGYTPQEPKNFLKHWPSGQMPVELADHPVVYVDLDDARAYAAWAGKRLPREEEWQLAAQGTDGRTWPWGNADPTPDRANLTGTHALGVRSCERGKSPFGCYHMSGNVYEWTESERSDGHTRFAMVRGGSYFDPQANRETSSVWYNDGGPRPCGHHAKFILMYPGLDRCATVGFRCVKDVASAASVAH